MKLTLKGITKTSCISRTQSLDLSQYSFDLRPKSFNFVQARKIKEMILLPSSSKSYSLIFENEKDFVVKEVFKDINSVVPKGKKLYLEFFGTTPLGVLEEFKQDYFWHYHDKERIRDISTTKYLKKIILHHEDLEYLDTRGELHGFFSLFSEYFGSIDIEVQLDWNSELITSLFEFFPINFISIEITNLVEVSYQNPDIDLINSHINNLKKILNSKKDEKVEDTNIK